MEPIHVPGPPKQAFNKHRRVSDLIRAQVNHLKHLEYKMPADVRETLPQHAITTEQDAALYIAAMTRFLRGLPAAAAPPGPVPVSNLKPPIPIRPPQGIAIAATAEPETKPEKPLSSGNSHAPEASK